MFRFLTDEEINERLSRQGLIKKKVKVTFVYSANHKEIKEIYRIVRMDSNEQQQ